MDFVLCLCGSFANLEVSRWYALGDIKCGENFPEIWMDVIHHFPSLWRCGFQTAYQASRCPFLGAYVTSHSWNVQLRFLQIWPFLHKNHKDVFIKTLHHRGFLLSPSSTERAKCRGEQLMLSSFVALALLLSIMFIETNLSVHIHAKWWIFSMHHFRRNFGSCSL